ncbi:hypothetical protein D3C81_1322150 [compost metagenome]
MLRLLLKFINAEILIRVQNAKAACFFERDVNDRDRTISVLLFVIVKHGVIVHFINVVSGKDQNMFWVILFNELQISENCISRSPIPAAAILTFVRRKNEDPSIFSLHIPVTAYANI